MSDRITAMDIEEQQFGRKVRGFDPVEVRLYLKSIAAEIERLTLENGEMLENAGQLKAELADVRAREQTLQKTLVSAQIMADELKERARAQADLVVKEARFRADQIVRQAQDLLARIEGDISRSRLERDNVERTLRGVIDQHLALLDLRREARGEMRAEPALHCTPPTG